MALLLKTLMQEVKENQNMGYVYSYFLFCNLCVLPDALLCLDYFVTFVNLLAIGKETSVGLLQAQALVPKAF